MLPLIPLLCYCFRDNVSHLDRQCYFEYVIQEHCKLGMQGMLLQLPLHDVSKSTLLCHRARSKQRHCVGWCLTQNTILCSITRWYKSTVVRRKNCCSSCVLRFFSEFHAVMCVPQFLCQLSSLPANYMPKYIIGAYIVSLWHWYHVTVETWKLFWHWP